MDYINIYVYIFTINVEYTPSFDAYKGKKKLFQLASIYDIMRLRGNWKNSFKLLGVGFKALPLSKNGSLHLSAQRYLRCF